MQRTSDSRTEIECSTCRKKATVPFVPTSDRPVYCNDCHRKRRARRDERAARSTQPRRRMLDQGQKDYFVYDALRVVKARGDLEDERRRAFVEMVFTRGARKSTDHALAFVQAKRIDDLITDAEAKALEGVVEKYTTRR